MLNNVKALGYIEKMPMMLGFFSQVTIGTPRARQRHQTTPNKHGVDAWQCQSDDKGGQ